MVPAEMALQNQPAVYNFALAKSKASESGARRTATYIAWSAEGVTRWQSVVSLDDAPKRTTNLLKRGEESGGRVKKKPPDGYRAPRLDGTRYVFRARARATGGAVRASGTDGVWSVRTEADGAVMWALPVLRARSYSDALEFHARAAPTFSW
ncbi:unnamed protein product, partial [Iphiclides podalirius]